MAKKATASTEEVFEETMVVEQPKKETPKAPAKPQWEIKDRTYFLRGAHSPLTFTLASRHTSKYPLLWFDNATGEQKEIRYATNQNSPFVDEQKGEATLGHVMFTNGTLFVPKEKQNLQKLLSLYHPGLNKKYAEFDAVLVAEDELDDLELQIEALNAAVSIDIDQAEAILRVEIGSKVSSMGSKEIKRDLILFARKNPGLFLDLANDENVQLRNFAIKASELGIIKLSQDQRTFTWGTNGAKLMTVPFDENPYSAMAAFFKTDEGVEVFKSVEKKLK
jgi:frataxin-like iron-binding protein CyaY